MRAVGSQVDGPGKGDVASAGWIVERIRFPEWEARMLRVSPGAEPGEVIAALDLPTGRPVLVVNGGTDDLPPEAMAALRPALSEVAAAAVEDGITLVTGATDAGVFALLGAALSETARPYVCVGVVPTGGTTWPGRPSDEVPAAAVALEAHHTHFVALKADGWGDETALMLDLAGALGDGAPSVAVLAGGGDLAEREVLGHLRARRPVLVLEGSGRLADLVAGIVCDRQPAPGRLAEVVRSRDLIEVWDTAEGGAALRAVLRRRLRRE